MVAATLNVAGHLYVTVKSVSPGEVAATPLIEINRIGSNLIDFRIGYQPTYNSTDRDLCMYVVEVNGIVIATVCLQIVPHFMHVLKLRYGSQSIDRLMRAIVALLPYDFIDMEHRHTDASHCGTNVYIVT